MVELADDSHAETARVLSAYCDAITVRTSRHRDLLELAEHASVPVLNARTDREHPCRALADCLTLRDRFGDLHGLPIAFVGGSDALAYSLIEAAILSGAVVSFAGSLPDPELLARAGEAVRICETPRDAVAGAAGVYAETPELMSLAAPGAIFMGATDQVANLLPVEQAVLRGLVSGEWEV
jgi:ornithine carbamoyltransferase